MGRLVEFDFSSNGSFSDFPKVENLPCLNNWKPTNTIESIMTELRRDIQNFSNRGLPQPEEGAIFDTVIWAPPYFWRKIHILFLANVHLRIWPLRFGLLPFLANLEVQFESSSLMSLMLPAKSHSLPHLSNDSLPSPPALSTHLPHSLPTVVAYLIPTTFIPPQMRRLRRRYWMGFACGEFRYSGIPQWGNRSMIIILPPREIFSYSGVALGRRGCYSRARPRLAPYSQFSASIPATSMDLLEGNPTSLGFP